MSASVVSPAPDGVTNSAQGGPAAIPLQTETLTKTFRQGAETVTALHGVSLTIGAGQFVAIMGASGSGKSTLLHVMGGLTQPDSGHVLVEGQRLSGMPDAALTDFRRRRIGLVFQQFNLIPALSAVENVLLPLLVEAGRDPVADRLRAIELLKKLGLGHRLDHHPDAMSGGEQQRVAIARALVTDPAIILADEPTGSLDSVNGKALCVLLKELNEHERRTIVIVTHEPAVAAWANRIVVMKDGQICSEFKAADFPDAHALAGHYQDIVARVTVASDFKTTERQG